MNLFEKMNEELLEESVLDLAKKAWARAKNVNSNSIKLAAQKFFVNHPGLLDYVKKMVGDSTVQSEENLIEASGFSKAVITVGLTLALLGGMVKPASASTAIIDASTNTAVAYSTRMSDLGQANDPNYLNKIIGGYLVSPDGAAFFIKDAAALKKYMSILQQKQVSPTQVFFLTTKNIEGTATGDHEAFQAGSKALNNIDMKSAGLKQ